MKSYYEKMILDFPELIKDKKNFNKIYNLHKTKTNQKNLSGLQLKQLRDQFLTAGYSQKEAKRGMIYALKESKMHMNDPWNIGKETTYTDFDFDGDGIPNAFDCYPFDKKRQNFNAATAFNGLAQSIGSSISGAATTAGTFVSNLSSGAQNLIHSNCPPFYSQPNLPNQVTKSSPQFIKEEQPIIINKESIPIKQQAQPISTNQPIQKQTIYYTKDTNKPYTIDTNNSRNVRDLNGNLVQPIFNTKIINGMGGGLSDVVRKDLSPNAVLAIQKGYNEKAVETVFDLNPLYASKEAKNIASTAAQNYISQNKIILYEPSVPDPAAFIKDKNISQGGYWNAQQNKIYISPDNQKSDVNATLLHEVKHSMQTPSNVSSNQTTNKLYDVVVQGKPLDVTQPNITGVNPQPDLIKNQLGSPLYSNTDIYGKKREIESYYIQEYYNRQQPRNDLIDAFEKTLGINTSRQLTPDQNKQYTDAMNILTTRAKQTNDMNTGIFKPMDKKEYYMDIKV